MTPALDPKQGGFTDHVSHIMYRISCIAYHVSHILQRYTNANANATQTQTHTHREAMGHRNLVGPTHRTLPVSSRTPTVQALFWE